jgi:hypothetical protein
LKCKDEAERFLRRKLESLPQVQDAAMEDKKQEFIAPNMTEEEKETLEQLRRDSDLQDQIPEEEHISISHPDKYSVSD